MPLYIWTAHDLTLASCWEFARDIQSRIDDIEARAYWDMRHCQDPGKRDAIGIHRDLLSRAADLVQRTWELYDWARDEGKTCKPSHPWDTEPASQSEYAKALSLKDGTPVSPMRGVVQLHKLLTEMFEEVMRL